MGCLFACFSANKHRKRKQLTDVTHFEEQRYDATSEVLQLTQWIKQAESQKPSSESKEKLEEPSSCITKKEVTVDLNAKTFEGLSIEEVNVTDNLVKNSEKKESEKIEDTPKEIKLDFDSSNPKEISHLPNNRYQNCVNSEDEIENLDFEECDLDDGTSNGDDRKLVQEESSESLFSLSIDSRKQFCEVDLGEKEVNSPMPIRHPDQGPEEIGLSKNARDRSQFVNSVLNPVENLTQWKVVKARATPPASKYQDKENVGFVQVHDILTCPEPNLKLFTRNLKVNSGNKKVVEQEIAVDTSLSSWLVESETTPMSKASTVSVGNSPCKNANSSRSQEDRPILGASAVEEIKQLSASPRQSRSRSPEELIIGTVGSYWKHTGKIIDSGSGSSSQGMSKTTNQNNKDERVKLQSTPFQVRLEKVLDIGVAEP